MVSLLCNTQIYLINKDCVRVSKSSCFNPRCFCGGQPWLPVHLVWIRMQSGLVLFEDGVLLGIEHRALFLPRQDSNLTFLLPQPPESAEIIGKCHRV